MKKNFVNEFQKIVCISFNNISNKFSKLDKKIRCNIIIFIFFVNFFQVYLYNARIFNIHLLYKCIIGSLLLFGLILFLCKNKINKIQWNNKVVILWLFLGLFQIITSLFISIEYLPMACIWLVLYPILFQIVENQNDIDVYTLMHKSLLYSSILFFVASIIFVPIHEGNYVGIAGNTNAVGQNMCAALPFFLFFYFFKSKDFLNFICLVLCISFIFLASGRTALVTTLFLLVVVSCFYYFSNKSFYHLLKKMIFLFLSCILGFNLCVFSSTFFEKVSENLNKKNIIEVQKDNQIDNNQHQNASDKELIVDNNQQLNGYIKDTIDRIEGSDKNDKSLNSYSSGRLGIWYETVSNLNILGHGSKEHIVTLRNGDVGNNTHNMFLQFAYDNGIIAGFIFVLLSMYSLKLLLKNIFLNKKDSKLILILLIHISFFITSLFTSMSLPFLYSLTFIYYFTYSKIFTLK